ncbi:MAG: DNA methyltransferase, partial [Promethearchaeota archaeon]
EDLRDAGNAWLIPYRKTTGATIKKGHEAPFPIELPYRCIKLTPNCQRVLDPFGGTCSTLAAAEYLGIEGTAYELFPRRKVIIERITSINTFIPQDDILIPHLEQTILVLSKNLKKIGENGIDISSLFQQTSKKAKIEYKIMKDVLKRLGVDLPGITPKLAEKDGTNNQKHIHLKKFLD